MDWEKLDKRIECDSGYKFIKKHEKVFRILEGLIVIGLLIGIVMFTIQDYEIKEQIADHCGYETSSYECVCDAGYVADWKDLQAGRDIVINFTGEDDAALDR